MRSRTRGSLFNVVGDASCKANIQRSPPCRYSRAPTYEVALAIMRGDRPIVAFRAHHGVTVRALAANTRESPRDTCPRSNVDSNLRSQQ